MPDLALERGGLAGIFLGLDNKEFLKLQITHSQSCYSSIRGSKPGCASEAVIEQVPATELLQIRVQLLHSGHGISQW